jgi:hypothetical protein
MLSNVHRPVQRARSPHPATHPLSSLYGFRWHPCISARTEAAYDRMKRGDVRYRFVIDNIALNA